MTAILLRIIIYVAIAAFVYFGARKIWRDLTGPFRGTMQPPPVRPDARARQEQPQVIDLTRDDDGVYRPPGERK